MGVRHMRDGHYRSFFTWYRTNETSISRCGLFHEMDKGRASRRHICQECPELCMEEHCVSIWSVEHIVFDNGRHFVYQGLHTFYDDIDIKSITSSVKHPQTNG